MKLKTHIIKYKSRISKYPNSFEKLNWQKTLRIYYFYNNILNSRKLIALNIILMNKFLIKYFFGYIKCKLKYFTTFENNLVNKNIFGFFTTYSYELIKEILKKN